MMQYVKVAKNLVGFMRATEVTVNEIDNSYNQHMHVLICVESTYFYNKENYITQKEWTQLWKRAMKLDYDPIVDVRAIRPKNKHKSDIKSAIEDRKSTRLNSSHVASSYAVFCLKKKKM